MGESAVRHAPPRAAPPAVRVLDGTWAWEGLARPGRHRARAGSPPSPYAGAATGSPEPEPAARMPTSSPARLLSAAILTFKRRTESWPRAVQRHPPARQHPHPGPVARRPRQRRRRAPGQGCSLGTNCRGPSRATAGAAHRSSLQRETCDAIKVDSVPRDQRAAAHPRDCGDASIRGTHTAVQPAELRIPTRRGVIERQDVYGGKKAQRLLQALVCLDEPIGTQLPMESMHRSGHWVLARDYGKKRSTAGIALIRDTTAGWLCCNAVKVPVLRTYGT